mgnify:CR=1 FL=1
MRWAWVFIVVSCGAAVGMLMGGLFGVCVGVISPELFSHVNRLKIQYPVGVAAVFGAIFGVLLGGGLSAFGIVIQTMLATNQDRDSRVEKTGN